MLKLETSGFYTLESNQKHDPTDVLYDFADKYEEVRVYDGLKNCILVNADKSRNLCVHDSYRQFLIPEMKGLLQYLNDYKPAGLTPYYPDRILLSISTTDPSNEALPATATPWNENFPSLEFSRPGKFFDDISTSTMYIDGEMAKDIYMFINNSETGGMFTQNGKEYLVFIRVLLPHEKVINTYQ